MMCTNCCNHNCACCGRWRVWPWVYIPVILPARPAASAPWEAFVDAVRPPPRRRPVAVESFRL